MSKSLDHVRSLDVLLHRSQSRTLRAQSSGVATYAIVNFEVEDESYYREKGVESTISVFAGDIAR